MRVLGRIVSFLLAVLLGFWLATANILTGTQVGDVMETIVGYLPDRQEVHEFFDGSTSDKDPEVNIDSDAAVSETDGAASTKNSDVDYTVVEEAIIKLTNDLRQEKGLVTLKSNDMLRKVAYIRAEEIEEQFSHTRPDGSDAFTVFQEDGILYPYEMVGENLAMGTKYLPNQEMAEFLFEGWVESEGHYANMIRKEFKEIGVGVHYDGEMLYATQIFGSRR